MFYLFEFEMSSAKGKVMSAEAHQLQVIRSQKCPFSKLMLKIVRLIFQPVNQQRNQYKLSPATESAGRTSALFSARPPRKSPFSDEKCCAIYYDQLSSANLHLGQKYPITSRQKLLALKSKSGRQFASLLKPCNGLLMAIPWRQCVRWLS